MTADSAPETPTSPRLTIDIASDQMTAWLRVQAKIDPEHPITAEEIVIALQQAGVEIDNAVKKRTAAFLHLLQEGKPAPERYAIAKGRPPQDASPEKITWDEQFARERAEWQEDEPADFYSFASLLTVEEGSLLGTIAVEQPAVDGTDVTGAAVAAQPPQPLEVDGTIQRTEDDPPKLIAQVSGMVVEEEHSLRIDEAFTVSGDVDFDTGNIDSNVAVVIGGMVQDRFEVRSSKSITVGKSIEAAFVTSEEDIVIKNGIVGRRRGVVTATGSVTTKYAADANIVTGVDLKVAKHLMNSLAFIGARLDGERASVIGGCTFARNEVSIANAGSGRGIPTRIVVGVDPDAVREVMALDKRIDAAEKKADESPAAEAQLAEDLKKRDELLKRIYTGNAEARVVVSKLIQQRVTIQVGDRETQFTDDYKGPAVIRLRKIEDQPQLVDVHPSSGSVTLLPSTTRTARSLMEVCGVR